MQIRIGLTFGRSGVGALLVVATLLTQGSAGAIPPSEITQQLYNRAAIGLIQRGIPLPDVMDYVAKVEDCASGDNSDPRVDRAACISKAGKITTDAGKELNLTLDDFKEATTAIGYWSFAETATRTSGSLTVVRDNKQNGGLVGSYKISRRGGAPANLTTAEFHFYASSDGYDFTYSTNAGDAGEGYVYWSSNGCMLLGSFLSNRVMDDNGNLASGVVVLRRC